MDKKVTNGIETKKRIISCRRTKPNLKELLVTDSTHKWTEMTTEVEHPHSRVCVEDTNYIIIWLETCP